VHLARGFELATILRELKRSRITLFPGVPSIFEMIGQLADVGRFKSLRIAYSAGAPLPASVYDKFALKCDAKIAGLYGATELGSITFTRPDDASFNSLSAGSPMDGVRVRFDEEQQLFVHAPSMFSGYIEERGGDVPSTFEKDGFFRTGDLGRVDENGNLVITGRLKLLIDVGGLKVNPLEVEAVIREHPQVADCVVVPMRMSETVFRMKALLTPREQFSPPDVQNVRHFARSKLSTYKVPRVFEIVDALPRSATGKVLRHLVEA
jgi:long-chain acyl-CoA synthetase